MMCISNSNNLVVLFLGIETMSITFYAITGFVRNREVAIEGALKYFLLGAFASAFLLYGLAMIYGATGSMYYNEITASILNLTTLPLYLKLGIGLTIVGLLFKIAAFPFHQWAPDVYQAAATPVTGFMSTAGKIAALAGFVGIALTVMPANTLQEPIILLNQNIKIIVAVIAALTMIVGNVTALSQKNIKRMLAYSSVGHAGYMLMGIVANNAEGITSIIYYSLAYTFTQIGAFIVISVIEKKNEANLDISDYAGLSKTYPYLAATMAMLCSH
ncbi:NADH-quinone oxidoreductase subunit N [bioreactor metagenome]|uniref:NADH-quinone oxidoreductase subunit N n=1 Tax=bioreactor metagenome TaxID=1076179 RepID=A0A645F0X9_9ZZZZ